LIKDTEEEGKEDLSFHAYSRAAAQSPGCAGKLAEAIHRDSRSFVEWRDEKRRRETREVVLYKVYLAGEPLARERLR
jgi:hypothetical protein